MHTVGIFGMFACRFRYLATYIFYIPHVPKYDRPSKKPSNQAIVILPIRLYGWPPQRIFLHMQFSKYL